MNQRRIFLKKSFTAVAAALIAPSVLKVNSSVVAEMAEPLPIYLPLKLSILSYSFHGLVSRGMQDIFGFFETCRYRYNLNTADLWNGHLMSTDDEYIAKVKEAMDERELYIPNLACDGCHILNTDPGKNKVTNENAWKHLKAAKKLGIGFVRIDAGPQLAEVKTDWTNQEFDTIVKKYKEYAQYAYDNGFKAGAENHMGPPIFWKNMKKLKEAVNHPGFAFCVHIGGWKGTAEEIVLADKECAPYAAHTHIPWNICDGPLAQKMNDLKAGGYKGYYSIEHHSARNEYEMVAIQLAKVQAVLRSWEMGGDGSEVSKKLK